MITSRSARPGMSTPTKNVRSAKMTELPCALKRLTISPGCASPWRTGSSPSASKSPEMAVQASFIAARLVNSSIAPPAEAPTRPRIVACAQARQAEAVFPTGSGTSPAGTNSSAFAW
jgi:hypothetical protein